MTHQNETEKIASTFSQGKKNEKQAVCMVLVR
jgi:hypothetical protein